MDPWEPLGPGIGLEMKVEHLVSGPVSGRAVRAARHLHGPPGYLQGGLCAGLLLGVARRLDPIGAPPTAVDVTLRVPTPLGERLGVVDQRIGAGEHELELVTGDTTLVTGSVQLTGHELASRAYDLQALGQVELPEPRTQTTFPVCWGCGPRNPEGLQLLPGWHATGQLVTGWIPDAAHDDGRGVVDPVVVAAALDCPTFWVNRHHLEERGQPAALLAGYHLRFFADVPVHEPVRVVAIADDPDGRKLHARSAVVDEDGIVYATAAAVWIAVDALPERDVA